MFEQLINDRNRPFPSSNSNDVSRVENDPWLVSAGGVNADGESERQWEPLAGVRSNDTVVDSTLPLGLLLFDLLDRQCELVAAGAKVPNDPVPSEPKTKSIIPIRLSET